MSSVADNRRRHSRHQITGSTSARLVHGADQTPIACDGVDLSQTGIGITTDRAMPVGTKVMLGIKGTDVQMIVKWALPPGVNGGKHRIGLGGGANDSGGQDFAA